MSSSGLIAARKRLENAIKKYDIPTDPEPNQASKCEDGVLLLSLLQSRLNWTNATFARYKTDPIQQPKRTSNTRRKWPNMKYLGTCTLQLGAHLHENTNFYEATRSDSWKDIAIKQGLMEIPIISTTNAIQDNELEPDSKPNVVMSEAEEIALVAPEEKQDVAKEEADKTVNTVPEKNNTTEVEKKSHTKQAQDESNTLEDPAARTHSKEDTGAVEDVPTANVELQPSIYSKAQQQSASNAAEAGLPQTQTQRQPQSQQPEEIPDEKLKFIDIVFELKEFPNERFIFPKDAIVQSTPAGLNAEDYLIIVSFVLPLDQTQTDEFFQKPEEKILRYGDTCRLPCIRDYYNQNTTRETRTTADAPLPLKSYQPVNIRMTQANITMVNALREYVHKTEIVRKSMKDKLKFFPKRKFLKFDVSSDETRQTEIRELIKRASVAPDISTGPVQAEKKRNEILNAIRLGKRERDEKFESELPKHKLNARDDGFMKCAYCSTKQTSMWRAGPGGHGTLCNSCGIQWNRGEILVGAPVITKEEEKRLWKEKKDKEKIAEALEMEKAEKEEERLKKKTKYYHSGGSSTHHQDFSYNNSTFAAQLLQQRNRQKQTNVPLGIISADTPTTASITSTASATNGTPADLSSVAVAQQPKSEVKKALPPRFKIAQAKTADPNVPIASAPPPLAANPTPATTIAQQTEQTQAPLQTQQQAAVPVPLSLYSPAGIPLPTLSIDFAGHLQFAHPNCGITLLDRHFSVRLFKDGCDQTTIEFDKKDLTNAIFEVITEGEAALKREVLKMKIIPANVKKITAFGKNIKIDKHGVNIRFLEKLDPSGGAVVQRILQRWLVTAPQ
ncbi:hypothetical protein [Parasitella parasitica]|uniref:GATA-type domain-containing protein n=1 Tax=Parasitella parasitica TaxID=35722 RepID=A0A0B7NCZ2_9FUNG|nr:hypothetical protein [Parasitella parasitica]